VTKVKIINYPVRPLAPSGCDDCAYARILKGRVEVGNPVAVVTREVAVAVEDVLAELGLQAPGAKELGASQHTVAVGSACGRHDAYAIAGP
jgi:hypothetical protein